MDHEQRILKICNGDREAYDFLCLWAQWCHEMDDVIDEDQEQWSKEKTIAAFARSILVLSHPFYLRHIFALRSVALLVVNMYADSVLWERHAAAWQQGFAEVYRHAGNEMVFAVAMICGGYEHMRSVSAEQRAICYQTQHPEEQNAA